MKKNAPRNHQLPVGFAALTLSVLMLLAAGCTAPGVTNKANSVAIEINQENSDTTSIVRPDTPAQVITNGEFGFTISESVRISSEVREAYSQALRLLDSGATQEGIDALNKVVELAPELAAPYIDLGIAHRENGDLKKAEANLKHALALIPDHPVAHNELGIVYRKTGRFQLARQSYESALGVVNDFHFAQRNLGVLCDLFLQDLECALTNYQAYQQAFPDDREVEMWIADIRNRLGSM